jgi:predicted esterase
MLTSQSPDSVVHTIETVTHGHYVTRVFEDAAGTLVGFHGYGENAERNLRELVRIPGTERWSLVAVQALHPFYVTKTGEVVASWMTKLDRELAIGDNLEYVRRVVTAVAPPRPLVFLGFSQGAAMAYRAAAAIACDGLIILGGDVPPEVIESGAKLPPVLIARGTRDEWYSTEKFDKDLRFLPDATRVEFDGGHEFTDDFRAAAGAFLASL